MPIVGLVLNSLRETLNYLTSCNKYITIEKSCMYLAARDFFWGERDIKVSPQCPLCKQGAEDIRHLMSTCSRAWEVWRALGLRDILNQALAVDRSGLILLA